MVRIKGFLNLIVCFTLLYQMLHVELHLNQADVRGRDPDFFKKSRMISVTSSR